MTDFTDQDKEMLDKLRKGFERKGKTSKNLDPWQEVLGHDPSLSTRSLLAAKVLEGFAGSWAAQYKYGLGSLVEPRTIGLEELELRTDLDGPPVPIRAKTSKIGLRGVPEINFQPFDCYTNKFGAKGPSLVGHPISFEVVGPTLKSNFCDWTWEVQEGAGVGGGDKLIMSVRPDGGPAISSLVADGYNLPSFTLGDPAEPNGGLYVIIADDGVNPGSIPAGRVPLAPLPPYLNTARYEIFRVVAVRVGEIDLHVDKRLSTYFDLPSMSIDRSLRAVTLIQPYVTRLQAIPGTGAGPGREQAFSVLIPERSASSDLYPPYNRTGGGLGSWLTGGFTDLTSPSAPGAVGSPVSGIYGGRMRLPVPQPLFDGLARVFQDNVATPPDDIGTWSIESGSIGTLTPDLIVRITHTARGQDLDDLPYGDVYNCLGWFPITSIPGPRVVLGRNAEVNPQTGLIFWGPGPFVRLLGSERELRLGWTAHAPISSLWGTITGFSPYNPDKVEASTLRNLINPEWVGRFEKQVVDPFSGSPVSGSGAGKPDRAIFNTASDLVSGGAENPGSLLDLGFRMVLFPAKQDPNNPNNLVPDFNQPIYSRETLINGSISEKQWIDIDYSAGVVRLSHPPPTQRAGVPDAPSQIIPNGLQGLTGNNPRGEVVLFAACVPYSMEESQQGTGNRVTGNPGGTLADADGYSEKVEAKLELAEMTFTGTSPFIGVSTYGFTDIVLDRVWAGPATGVITITGGGDISAPFGRWGYTEVRTELAGPPAATYPVTVLSGISAVPGATNPDPALFGGAQTRGVLLRREVVFGDEDISAASQGDLYPLDTAYGSSVRAETLRFRRAKVLPNLDGSVSVQPLPDLAAVLDRPHSSLVPSRNPRPVNLIGNPNPFLIDSSYFSETGYFQGMLYQTEAGDPRGLNPGGGYITLSQPASPSLLLRPGSLNPVPWWHGVITPFTAGGSLGVVRMGDNWRLVAKVSVQLRDAIPDPGTTIFVGFVQDESGPGLQPTVGVPGTGFTSLATMFPSFSGVGFYLDSGTVPLWNFWHRGAGLPDVFIPTRARVVGTGEVEGPWYLVLESNRQNPGNLSSAEIKFGIYDNRKRLLSSTLVTDTAALPITDGRNLCLGLGVREEGAGASGDFLYVHHVQMSADIEAEDLPPLP